MLANLVTRLRGLVQRRKVARELDDELQFHLEMEVQRRVALGATPDTARREAHIDFGGIEQTKEAVRDVRAVWLESAWQDVRFALRMLRRHPGFAATACLTLALGIGANDAIFSIVDAAVLRPLPYRNAERLVDVGYAAETRDGHTVMVPPDGRHAAELRAVKAVFEAVEAFTLSTPKALAEATDSNPWVGAFTPGFPKLLGVMPQRGRVFDQHDVDAQTGIIISDAYWRQALNRDPHVLGKTIAFSDQTRVVIGVMPPTFRYFVGPLTDAWLPVADGKAGRIVARLRPGVTLQQAEHDLAAALARPESAWHPRRVEIWRGDWERGSHTTRAMLFCLVGAVGLLLVIACVNVANMLLSRTLAREREISIRRALGASRLQLARLFLAEALIIAGLGGVAAVGLAWCGIKLVPVIIPTELQYSWLQASLPELDGRLIGFGCVMALLTGALCGIAPSLRAARAPGFESPAVLGPGASRAAVTGRGRLGLVFQALQVAMTLVLLAGAGLFVTGFVKLVNVPLGFDATRLGYAGLILPRAAYPDGAARAALLGDLIARIGHLPGVEGATAGPPPVGSIIGLQILLDGAGKGETAAFPQDTFFVGPDYFRVAGIALREGRPFGPEDERSERPLAAIISDNAAQRYWPGQPAIGQRFRLFPGDPPLTVVGIVRHTTTIQVSQDAVQLFLPVSLSKADPDLLFRLTPDGTRQRAAVMAMVRSTIRAAAPNVTMRSFGTVDALLDRYDPGAKPRFYAFVLALFAGLAVATAAAGLYGLLSYSVSRRTQEIGVRMALGADTYRVRRLVLAQVLLPVAAGVVGGLVAAAWLSRFVSAQLFRVAPTDPIVYGAVVGLFLAVSTLAAYFPVRRATRIAPATALRME